MAAALRLGSAGAIRSAPPTPPLMFLLRRPQDPLAGGAIHLIFAAQARGRARPRAPTRGTTWSAGAQRRRAC
jgi:hypothetical protein